MSLEEIFKEADLILPRYPLKEAALLPTLHLVQRSEGYLSPESIKAVSQYLEIPAVRVEKVISFYTMFRRQPVGKYLIQVCLNLSCSLLDADHLLDYLKGLLGIDVGQTTADGLFTLITVECLGSCGTAPMMQINDDYHENLTETKISEIIESLRKEAGE
ncbi:NADH-quinone oxidoreductase subunit NuoE [candidate division CSSED10-310 bacterium]|uniref:NADH-quinone oxidoreductase subunit NuoE n=1 Tax=candidate division CSSED10-310 bacterium TaxID=2855610 RepID=A0ABV6YY40_UNCC1